MRMMIGSPIKIMMISFAHKTFAFFSLSIAAHCFIQAYQGLNKKIPKLFQLAQYEHSILSEHSHKKALCTFIVRTFIHNNTGERMAVK